MNVWARFLGGIFGTALGLTIVFFVTIGIDSWTPLDLDPAAVCFLTLLGAYIERIWAEANRKEKGTAT